MTNTTQGTSQPKEGSIFLFLLAVMLLLLVLGWPEYRSGESGFAIGAFVTSKAILGGLLIWQLVRWIRSRKQSGAENEESPRQG
jgi:hypothetical protein